MLFFILWLGQAVQCTPQTGCIPVPYEATALMAQIGVIELFAEVGVYRYYRKASKKKDKDE
jgi:hypothetical protein